MVLRNTTEGLDMPISSWDPDELKSEIDKGGMVLVDFKAHWCPQCTPQVRVVERIASDYQGKVEIGTLDLGQYADASDTYNISALPTLLIFKGGELIQELKGYTKAAALTKALDTQIEVA
jgi:thioredoxin